MFVEPGRGELRPPPQLLHRAGFDQRPRKKKKPLAELVSRKVGQRGRTRGLPHADSPSHSLLCRGTTQAARPRALGRAGETGQRPAAVSAGYFNGTKGKITQDLGLSSSQRRLPGPHFSQLNGSRAQHQPEKSVKGKKNKYCETRGCGNQLQLPTATSGRRGRDPLGGRGERAEAASPLPAPFAGDRRGVLPWVPPGRSRAVPAASPFLCSVTSSPR